MKAQFLPIRKLGTWCLFIGILSSCQKEDDIGGQVPRTQDEYSAYEATLLTSLRHFGDQLQSNPGLGFDHESLTSISASFFGENSEEHMDFVETLSSTNETAPTSFLQEKSSLLHDAISDHTDHSGYLTYLSGQFDEEFLDEATDQDEKEKLLHHIIHLKTATQFIEEHQDLFTTSVPGGRVSSSDWWKNWGQCALNAVAESALAVAAGVTVSAPLITGAATATLLDASDSASLCYSQIFKTANDFVNGITSNPYVFQDSIYNMYSYGYVVHGSDSTYLTEGKEPPVLGFDQFTMPGFSSLNLAITNDTLGPFIGTTTDGSYFAMTDCSGFVSYIIQTTSSDALSQIMNNLPAGAESHLDYCPSAAQFANFQAPNSTYWKQILGTNGDTDFSLIQPGDIIAWDELPDSGDSDTGHVMIAATSSQMMSDGTYRVEIFDSTEDAHLHDDRSGIVHGNDSTGVGAGTIGFRIMNSDLQSNFYPGGSDPWVTHPHITILRFQNQ